MPGSGIQFDAVIFDLDGTLADSGADIAAALERAFRDVGRTPTVDVRSLVDGSPLEEIFAASVPGGTPHELRRFVDSYRKHYHDRLVVETRLYPGVRETLEALGALRPRVRLAVASSKRQQTAQDLLRALEVEDFFDAITGSGASTMPPKPAPDLLLHTASALGVSPSRSLMIGDTPRDIVAGRRAGMRTAAVTYGFGSADAIAQAGADYVFEEIDELLIVLGMRE